MMTQPTPNNEIRIGDTVKLNETYNNHIETVIDIWDNIVHTDRGIRHITKIVKVN